MSPPAFWSLALAEIRDPDFTHVAVGVLPAHATADPAAWARSLMSRDSLPRWLAAVLTVHDLIRRTPSRRCTALAVSRTEGEEALVSIDGRRIDLRIAVGVDEARALVRVVATARFKGGRRRWRPLEPIVPPLVAAMMARSRRGLSGVTQ